MNDLLLLEYRLRKAILSEAEAKAKFYGWAEPTENGFKYHETGFQGHKEYLEANKAELSQYLSKVTGKIYKPDMLVSLLNDRLMEIGWSRLIVRTMSVSRLIYLVDIESDTLEYAAKLYRSALRDGMISDEHPMQLTISLNEMTNGGERWMQFNLPEDERLVNRIMG